MSWCLEDPESGSAADQNVVCGQALDAGVVLVEVNALVAILLKHVQQNCGGGDPAGILFAGPDLLGNGDHILAESGIAAFVGGKAAAGRQDAGSVVVVSAQFGSFALTDNTGNGDGAVGADEAFEGLIRESKDGNNVARFHVAGASLGTADEDVDCSAPPS